MRTATATPQRTIMSTANGNGNGNGQQVAILQAPRLPYHPAIEERFGVDKASWKALTEAIYPNAKTTDSIVMALSYCRARKLDPFKRPVHIVPMWSSASGGYVETVWPGISEIRTTAFRTGQYAGCDETVFGEEIEHVFKGKVKAKDGWKDKTITLRFPEWARITVYRDLNGRVCKFVGPKVKWIEAYATIGNSDLPNEMWEVRSEGQLEKCAEAAALRKAFPEEVGNMLAAEEMEGRTLDNLTEEQRQAASGERPTLSNALDELAKGGAAQAAAEGEIIEQAAVEEGAAPIAPAEELSEEPPPEDSPPKRSPRIELELALKKTINVRAVLTFLQENATAIGALPEDERKLFDTAVLKHQDDLKKPSKD
jgi:phage recombination protein Bet